MLLKDHSGHNSEVVKMSEQSVGVRVVLTLGSEVVKKIGASGVGAVRAESEFQI